MLQRFEEIQFYLCLLVSEWDIWPYNIQHFQTHLQDMERWSKTLNQKKEISNSDVLTTRDYSPGFGRWSKVDQSDLPTSSTTPLTAIDAQEYQVINSSAVLID